MEWIENRVGQTGRKRVWMGGWDVTAMTRHEGMNNKPGGEEGRLLKKNIQGQSTSRVVPAGVRFLFFILLPIASPMCCNLGSKEGRKHANTPFCVSAVAYVHGCYIVQRERERKKKKQGDWKGQQVVVVAQTKQPWATQPCVG